MDWKIALITSEEWPVGVKKLFFRSQIYLKSFYIPVYHWNIPVF